MNRPSRKHHFVPQAQLRHFAADPERRSIYVFAKRSDRSFLTSIANAGSENDFNVVSLGDTKWNFEDLFQEVDARSARLVVEIVSRRSLAWMTADDRIALADFFATQMLRTHFSRTGPKHLAGQLREMMRQVGYDRDADPHMAMPSDASVRLGAVKAFLEREGHTVALLDLHPAIYASDGEHRFIISDHPVSRINAFPYGNVGLTSPGLVVMLPVSPGLTLALHCQTIVQRYELAASADIEPERKTRMIRYRDGLRSGEPIAIDGNMVRYLNGLQVSQSAGYLYADTDAFDFAREILGEDEDLRSVETHVELGEMGHAPPPRPGMPAGTHLVIFGPLDHCTLAIEEIDKSGEGLTARTRQIDLLAQVAADKAMLRVELYVDRRVRRGMGQVMVERFGEPASGWFRVVHRDASLRSLGLQLDAERR
ncbi:DUF4238 domain-containing protein [Mesorhizobium sp. M8A.F.Ca.ET.208.01.1.1]|uniref:DUF4238 domain-containing protein n=1 Tax=unclassified Mesorhizobium TaxID=325217 RepID=UPI00109406D9|nr:MULTISPECIES: DUF4238 domain-containing protein [unclassified Mesorhizobium]TGQ89033.1 DUF4238 domain-containing protein [Mesorhizobium sp. M8A.F.Ca.ET.208.01.1.1]TGR32137.1 DUF4238 domain-containing protein [Mesorhizobium sp. M8A.F.Ca.ET.202.01.1.1]TGT50352.1 DUF4238 domain-containing protein [Mesorhizobium sp. M8A.F.Ca.ET.167.01.1.1]TGU40014.1 DUF4238 domain-containing protein [bacterium M00.F.Ca.ET.156.01.1.1]